FALFGGNAAHFTNDPLCRRWTDADAPSVVRHTSRLLEPEDQPIGAWDDPSDIPETLVALLRELGRMYLPWASRARVEGDPDLVFAGGSRVRIAATEFLREARSALLARYAVLRDARLDAWLERAGVLGWFADFSEQAGALPDFQSPPRPRL